MHSGGRWLALLSAWLVVASSVGVDGRLNKCCAKSQHVFFDLDLARYRCRDPQDLLAGIHVAQSGPQDHLEGHYAENGTQYSFEGTAEASNGTLATSLDFESFLLSVGQATLGGSQVAEDVAEDSMPSCDVVTMDYAFRPDFELVHESAHNDYALRFLAGSQVLLRENRAFPEDFPSTSFCVDQDDEGDLLAMLCPCALVPCVRKCCRHGEAFVDEVTHECVADPKMPPWRPRAVHQALEFYVLNEKLPVCTADQTLVVVNFAADELTLQDDGSLEGTETECTKKFARDSFCAEFSAATRAHLVFYCADVDRLTEGLTILKGVVTLLAAIALLVTVSLTVAFPEMRANIHGKMALCHNAALLVAFVFIAIMQLAGNKMATDTCKGFSFAIQYSLLAAFFWLNVMCVEVSWVFSAVRPIQRAGPGLVDRKFAWYSAYAWGTASLISLVTLLVEFVPGASFKPRFGETVCFFDTSSKIPALLFLFGPMAVLLLVNLALFVFTASKIMHHRRQTSILSNNDSTTNNRNKQNLVLYTKLFTLMGVTWLFEVISWAVGGHSLYWLATDLVNLLRGVFIFVIFCCKRSVLDALRSRGWWRQAAAAQGDGSSSGATKSTGAFGETGNELSEVQPNRWSKSPT